MKKIGMTWYKIQECIKEMMPRSRRRNQYCKAWETYGDVQEVLAHTSNMKSWWENYIGTRYSNLNFESFWLRGTVEFRIAAGTTDYEKISNWVIFTQNLIDQAKKLSCYEGEFLFSELVEKLKEPLENQKTKMPKLPSQEEPLKYMAWQLALEGLETKDIAKALIRVFGENKGYQYYYDQAWYMKQKTMQYRQYQEENSNITTNEDLLVALDWAQSRWNIFRDRI
jgi:hypothetical protein